MVDFKKLQNQQRQAKPIDPIEIFRRLPKSPGFNDLWHSQADALQKWYGRRKDQDLVIKLNTGGGKTLVGLLIAHSIINELKGPVLYLCPTRQLQNQILQQSARYKLPAVAYTSGQGLPRDFYNAKAVLIATYEALFNGRSKFGVTGHPAGYIELQGIILDDAHTAFSNLRKNFTLSIEQANHPDLYDELTALFRHDFVTQGRQGTFTDVLTGSENIVLEVPYVSWSNRSDHIQQLVSPVARESFPFVWPLIRDSFDLCHALISGREFTITPLYPMVDMFPSFLKCPRRVYMSATVAEDSSIIRTFDASIETVTKPIMSSSLAGVGERMVLIPQLMNLTEEEEWSVSKDLAQTFSQSCAVVAIAPSRSRADTWSDVASATHGSDVEETVEELVSGKTQGPVVLVNRYDGIDLPEEGCRLLILIGAPRGISNYELFRSAVLHGSDPVNTTLAQRIEQGMGRGTRGSGDHCVVLLEGLDLASWISRNSNLELLTTATQAQVHLGVFVSQHIDSVETLSETVRKCLARDPDWLGYHAQALADATSQHVVNTDSLQMAHVERRYFAQLKNGDYGKAATMIEKFAREKAERDRSELGWLLELGARAAHLDRNYAHRDKLQKQAYGCNRNLHRPAVRMQYTPVTNPTKQTENIAHYVSGFALIGGAVLEFDRRVSHLVPDATSNQFEEALLQLGRLLGFSCERPEKEYDIGPDVLWILDEETAWIIEAKSRKDAKNPLSKAEHGQVREAEGWFNDNYENLKGIRVVVHPNTLVSERVTAGETMALTLSDLGRMVGDVRALLSDLTSELRSESELVARCEAKIRERGLDSRQIANTFLVPFEG